MAEIAQGAQSVSGSDLDLSKYTQAHDQPVSIQNLKKEQASLVERMDALDNGQGTANDLSHIRIGLSYHFNHLRQGGEDPDPIVRERTKGEAAYQELVKSYAGVQERLAAMEKKYLGATYGYQMSDGSILAPDLTWSDDQLKQVTDLALHNTARAWKDENRSEYAY